MPPPLARGLVARRLARFGERFGDRFGCLRLGFRAAPRFVERLRARAEREEAADVADFFVYAAVGLRQRFEAACEREEAARERAARFCARFVAVFSRAYRLRGETLRGRARDFGVAEERAFLG